MCHTAERHVATALSRCAACAEPADELSASSSAWMAACTLLVLRKSCQTSPTPHTLSSRGLARSAMCPTPMSARKMLRSLLQSRSLALGLH